MRVRIGSLFLAIACCLLFAPQARATDYAYGYTSLFVDSGNVVRGYHRTEVDYNTDVYYRPYVCASLYKDGVEVVRACGGGFASATRNTQTTDYAGSTYSALTDHYVNIEYEEEDPYNPGYYYYPDNLGYSFSGAGSHPIDWYYVASGFYNTRPDESIHLGDTHVQLTAITLTVDISPEEIRPNGTGGTSTATITVSTSPATSGKSITFSAVAHNNGGHVGHVGVRPVGSFNPSQGTTGVDGKASTTYTSAIVGGGVDITQGSAALTLLLLNTWKLGCRIWGSLRQPMIGISLDRPLHIQITTMVRPQLMLAWLQLLGTTTINITAWGSIRLV